MKYLFVLLALLSLSTVKAQELPRAKEVLIIEKLHPERTTNYVNLVATELQERLKANYHFRQYSIYKLLVGSEYTDKRKSRSKSKKSKNMKFADVHITIKGVNILNPADSFVMVTTIRGKGEEDKDIYKNAVKKYWRDPEIFAEIQSHIIELTSHPCEKFTVTKDMINTKAELIIVDNSLKSMLPNNHCIDKIQELKAHLRDRRDSLMCKKELHLIKKEINTENYNPTRLTERLIRLSPFAQCRAKAVSIANSLKSNLQGDDELEPILDDFIEAMEDQDIHVWTRLQMKL